jgi:hypothetical protein
MLVADLSLITVENAPLELKIDSIKRQPSGGVTLSWQAGPGLDDTVEYSPDLVNWLDTLPGSAKGAPSFKTTFEFTDPTSPNPARRFYRIRRTSVGSP